MVPGFKIFVSPLVVPVAVFLRSPEERSGTGAA